MTKTFPPFYFFFSKRIVEQSGEGRTPECMLRVSNGCCKECLSAGIKKRISFDSISFRVSNCLPLARNRRTHSPFPPHLLFPCDEGKQEIQARSLFCSLTRNNLVLDR